MQYGLFGKLPARRDFITQAVPRSFLRLWEPWIESAMAECRVQFGAAAFEDHFRAAPIWRFWLGADISGSAILGAFMPSMDAVGRYFPLTLIGIAEDEVLAPPTADSHDGWFAAVEHILLSSLEPNAAFETMLDNIAQLKTHAPPATARVSELKFGTPFEIRPPLPLAELLAVCRLAYQDCSLSAASFWWTVGGAHFRPIGLMRKQLPETRLFAGMLTGQFERREDATIAIEVKPL
jgi:type VI secretion system protein ImpM